MQPSVDFENLNYSTNNFPKQIHKEALIKTYPFNKITFSLEGYSNIIRSVGIPAMKF